MTYLFQLHSPVTICIDASPAKLRKGKVAESKGKVKKSTFSTVHKEHCIVLSSGESDSDEQVGFIGIHVTLLEAHVHQRAFVCLSFCSRMILSLNEVFLRGGKQKSFSLSFPISSWGEIHHAN